MENANEEDEGDVYYSSSSNAISRKMFDQFAFRTVRCIIQPATSLVIMTGNNYAFSRTVCALLKRDISIINDEDDASNTPLHLAALQGYDKVAKELLDRGAAIDAR